jgi:hypothetical protein
MKRIARVFPTKTKASPRDSLAFFGPPGLFPPAVDEVHISVAFTWDLEKAERLKAEWSRIAPVKIGGPATGQPGAGFEPGRYLRPGYTITSRGCPNTCWFCDAWKREGTIRELPIREGFNILDDNLLACSENHLAAVFAMLRKQKDRVQFSGGLEAKLMTSTIAAELRAIKPDQLFMAYDTPDDWEPLQEATRLLFEAGFPRKKHCLRAYVLCGFPGDSLQEAERRMRAVLSLGVFPAAMAWRRKEDGWTSPEWATFQRRWFRPAAIAVTAKEARSSG